MLTDYSTILSKISLYNVPTKVGSHWFMITRGDFLGSSKRLFILSFKEDEFGMVPVWTFLGFVELITQHPNVISAYPAPYYEM